MRRAAGLIRVWLTALECAAAEKLKARVLRSDGVEALVGLLKKGNLRETLSHASCTIANLATNGDSNEALLNHGRLVSALCELSASLTDDSEIQRHIIRGLANFALYDSNKAALVSAVPEIVRLGHVASSDIQRHAIRAIDNLLIVRTYRKEARVCFFR